MPDYNLVSGPNTGAAYVAQAAASQVWQKLVERFAENCDFWNSMEGSSDDSIIITGEDLAAGAGMTMNIRISGGFYKKPTFGETPFGSESQFEKRKLKDYQLKINLIRHATSYNELSEELLGARGEINAGVPEDLGNWLGRFKAEQMDQSWIYKVNQENHYYSNNKTMATLGAADGLKWNDIIGAGALMGRWGGGPGRVSRSVKGQQPDLRLTLVATSSALAALRKDSDYQSKVINAQARSLQNSIFTGVVPDVDGVAVVERRVVDHDGDGPIGSPQEPRALLGEAVIAAVNGNEVLEIKGGGNPTSAAMTDVDYFRYFEAAPYSFMDGSTTPITNDEKYFLIVNPANHVTAPNKIGMYAYTTGNNGNKITITKRLGAADLGSLVKQTVGAVTWNTGVWAGLHTNVHPAGAAVIQCNAKGEPIGRSFLLGRAAAVRGYGKHRAKRGSETEEDGFFTKVFLRSYFGQSVRQNMRGQYPGIIVLNHALHYSDMPLPTVV
jgi:hypothetical protein